MKKIIPLVVFILLAANVLAVTNLGTYQTKNIDITLVNQDPDPVEPGNYVKVRFKIENSGYANAEDVTFEIQPEYPFSLDPDQKAVKKIGSVHGKQIGDIGVIIDYRLKVDENAVEGNEPLEFRYKIQDGSWIEPQPFDIEIRTVDALLSIEEITKEPFEPGKAKSLSINIENLADSYLKNFKFTLDVEDTVFSPVGSSNEKSLLKLKPKEKKDIEFNLMAGPDAEAGIYKVPLSITYYDELNNQYSSDLTLGLLVGSIPDLSVILEDTTIHTTGQKGSITIRFVNKGTTNLKFMNAYLQATDGVELLSNKEVYVGEVESDDYETAEYELYVDSEKDKLTLPLNIEYKDANNNEYEETINLELPLFSSSQAKKFGYINGNPWIGIIIVIVIVVAGIFIYRKYRKK